MTSNSYFKMYILNGEIREEDKLINRSFKYGDGLFETIRIYNGKILFWESHLERLFRGMGVLKLHFQPKLFALKLLMHAQGLMERKEITGHGRLRIHIYRIGKGAYGPLERTAGFLIEASGFEGNTYDSLHPVSLCCYDAYRLYPQPLNGCKTANAFPYILAAIHAQDEGFDEALLLTNTGFVSEASAANLFMIQQQKIITPPLNTFCLDGVMRKQMLHLAQELKLSIVQKCFRLKELRKADAIFLTNSTRGIIPIHQFEGRALESQRHPLISFLKNCLVQYVEGGPLSIEN